MPSEFTLTFQRVNLHIVRPSLIPLNEGAYNRALHVDRRRELAQECANSSWTGGKADGLLAGHLEIRSPEST